MDVGFSVVRFGNVWKLRMQDTKTEGTFGTLKGAMQAAYHLADGLKDWQTDSDGGAT